MDNNSRGSFSFLEDCDRIEEDVILNNKLLLLDLSPIYYWVQQRLTEDFSMVYVQQLIYQLKQLYKPGVKCCIAVDNKPWVKYDLVEGSERYYKKNRMELRDFQIRHRKTFEFATRLIAKELGIMVCGVEGYEADDVIYNMKTAYYDSFDNIEIYSKDSDMFFMIDEKTQINRGTLGMMNMKNFNTIGHSTGINLPYNFAPLYSIYYKNKDNRGRIYKDRFLDLTEEWAKFPPDLFCSVDSTIDIAESIMQPFEVDILKLAMPIPFTIEQISNLEDPRDFNINFDKLMKYYYIACSSNYEDPEFKDVYDQVKEFYGR